MSLCTGTCRTALGLIPIPLCLRPSSVLSSIHKRSCNSTTPEQLSKYNVKFSEQLKNESNLPAFLLACTWVCFSHLYQKPGVGLV